MSERTCSTCRFMAAPRGVYFTTEDGDVTESEHRTCVRVIHGNTDHETAATLQEPAVVVDGSGYAARLLVLPTFGCLLHEEK